MGEGGTENVPLGPRQRRVLFFVCNMQTTVLNNGVDAARQLKLMQYFYDAFSDLSGLDVTIIDSTERRDAARREAMPNFPEGGRHPHWEVLIQDNCVSLAFAYNVFPSLEWEWPFAAKGIHLDLDWEREQAIGHLLDTCRSLVVRHTQPAPFNLFRDPLPPLSALRSNGCEGPLLTVSLRGTASGLVAKRTHTFEEPSEGNIVLNMEETSPVLTQEYNLELGIIAGQLRTIIVVESLSQPTRALALLHAVPESNDCTAVIGVPRALKELECHPKDGCWAQFRLTVLQTAGHSNDADWPSSGGPFTIEELENLGSKSSWASSSVKVAVRAPDMIVTLLHEPNRATLGCSLSSTLAMGQAGGVPPVTLDSSEPFVAVKAAVSRIASLLRSCHLTAAEDELSILESWIGDTIAPSEYLLRYLCVSMCTLIQRELALKRFCAIGAIVSLQPVWPCGCRHMDDVQRHLAEQQGNGQSFLRMAHMERMGTVSPFGSLFTQFLLDVDAHECESYFMRTHYIPKITSEWMEGRIQTFISRRFGDGTFCKLMALRASITSMLLLPTKQGMESMQARASLLYRPAVPENPFMPVSDQRVTLLEEELAFLSSGLRLWVQALELSFSALGGLSVWQLGLKNPSFDVDFYTVGERLPSIDIDTAHDTSLSLQQLYEELIDGGLFPGLSSFVALTMALLSHLTGDGQGAVDWASRSLPNAKASGLFSMELLCATHVAIYQTLYGELHAPSQYVQLKDISSLAWKRGCPNFATGSAVLLMRVASIHGLSLPHQRKLLSLALVVLSEIHSHIGEARCFLTLATLVTDPLEAIELVRSAADVLTSIEATTPDQESKLAMLYNSVAAAKASLEARSTQGQQEAQRFPGEEANESYHPDQGNIRETQVRNLLALANGEIPTAHDSIALLEAVCEREPEQLKLIRKITAKAQLFRTQRNLQHYCEQVLPSILEDIELLDHGSLMAKVRIFGQLGAFENLQQLVASVHSDWISEPGDVLQPAIDKYEELCRLPDPCDGLPYDRRSPLLKAVFSYACPVIMTFVKAKMGAEALKILEVIDEGFGEESWSEQGAELDIVKLKAAVYWMAGVLDKARVWSLRKLQLLRRTYLADIASSSNEQFAATDYLEAGFAHGRICVSLAQQALQQGNREAHNVFMEECLNAVDPFFGSSSAASRKGKALIARLRQEILELERQLQRESFEHDTGQKAISSLREQLEQAERNFVSCAPDPGQTSGSLVKEISSALSEGHIVLLLSACSGEFEQVVALIRSGDAPILAGLRSQNGAFLHRLLVQLSMACNDHGNMSWSRHSRTIASLLFPEGDPLLEALQSEDVTTVYVMQQGFLQLLPFHTLLLEGMTDPIGITKRIVTIHRLRGLPAALAAEAPSFASICKESLLVGDTFDMETTPSQAKHFPTGTEEYVSNLRPVKLDDLGSSGREVDSIRRIISDYCHKNGRTDIDEAVMLKGEKAVAENVLKHLGDSSHVHIATHCVVSTTAPMLSAICLTKGKNIILEKLYNIRRTRRLELVTLSACNTGNGKPFDSHIGGFVYALLHLSSRSLIVSTQDVLDDFACSFMDTFYKELSEDNKSVEEALRIARKAVYFSATCGSIRVAKPRHGPVGDEEEVVFEDPPTTFMCDGCGNTIVVHWQRQDGIDFDMCDTCYKSRPELRKGVSLVRLDGNQVATNADPTALSFHPSAWAPFTLILNTM